MSRTVSCALRDSSPRIGSLRVKKPSQDERPYVSLVARAMEKLGRSNEVPHDLQDHLIRFSATDAYQPHPIWEIADPDMWHSKYSDGEFFEDKIVIVGPSAPV